MTVYYISELCDVYTEEVLYCKGLHGPSKGSFFYKTDVSSHCPQIRKNTGTE